MSSVLLLLLALGVPPSPASPPPAAKVEIEAAFERARVALAAKDVSGFLAVLTDDWTGKDPVGGVMSRQELEEALTQRFRSTLTNEVSISIESVEVIAPDQAVVTFSERNRITTLDEKGASHVQETSGRERATWVKTEGGWKMRVSEVVGEPETRLDGELVKAP